ncbi:Tim44 domain-containing protein [Accumulibacter sp.]|uniref:Tim44 domain-containing protein n=1 Tax=Accumulibacter sp. TaxID=2053492 RepID=UPI0025DF4723|nr:Tim44-like domain-containing protein [Accumulibacter sp.]MCM8595443.1 Tim44-like domain-containing protein [Accumulibacter sp.]MCM8626376.1 Tim44-like domain-containing protein [Accumulibacter sp.]MDS4049590.1 Tim44-like domain-containing protein [Accumulibacter sp.]
MKSFAMLTAVLALGLTLVAGDAEAAKRLGGGKSSGMQRESVTMDRSASPASPANASRMQPAATTPQAGAAAAQAQPKRSWMGPLAGLAAGLGLAALASHFGFGEELASLLMIGLLVLVVMVVIGFVMRRRSAAQGLGANSNLQYAGAGYGGLAGQRVEEPLLPASGSSAPAAAGTAAPSIPADFDVEGFVRNAKVNFIRLQAANDAGNLDDLREFTTPEMFAELRMNINERGGATQQTDVVTINAEVLEVAEEATRYVVSVRFTGLIREDRDAAAEPIDEVWHMVKPREGRGGWVLAGIQQLS